METRTQELNPSLSRRSRTELTGNRTRHLITFNPNSAKPGEEIYVNIPKLKPDSVLVPDSMALIFDFKNANEKSWFRNNLGKLLQKRLEIRLAGEKVYDNSGKSLLEIYKDLWMDEKQRADMIQDGITTEAVRKKISKDDEANADADATALFGIFGTKQRLKITKILGDHGLYAPYHSANDLQYVITLPQASEIMNAQSGETVDGYSLENLELEYESIENVNLARKSENLYGAERELSFEHVTLMKKTEWDKSLTIVNETVNLPRRSMKAIVMLFTEKTPTDSEEYIFPNIDKVKVTIEGVPNVVYSQGMTKTRMYEEAKRLFGTDVNGQQSLIKFYKDKKLALVIDLRTANDDKTYGNGVKIQNTQSGILIEITKKATTAKRSLLHTTSTKMENPDDAQMAHVAYKISASLSVNLTFGISVSLLPINFIAE
ncbi:Hypothetical predicted protein [Paramuricea clavata]|uniref:Uncharacterized protein n=1 Tax=Paramuricea clavata TaxID=317549 RepID=A0A7D9JGD5_PARCT|nr:Hypothetical predicted protein [Paramuricea clavata]